jgi:phosphatidate cytidylyltransferase
LIWFILPSSLVICNDIFAYFAGFFFGRTPLIKLSPKKTWEGFLGGFLATVVISNGQVILGFILSGYLSQFSYMTCSLRELNTHSKCDTNPVFLPREIHLLPVLTGIDFLIPRWN